MQTKYPVAGLHRAYKGAVHALGLAPIALILAGSVAVRADEIPPITLETKQGPIVMQPIKHGSVLITFLKKYYYIDPAQLPDGVDYPKADVILVTHEHGDHLDPAQIAKLSKPDTIVISNPNSKLKLKSGEVMKNGDKRNVLDIGIEAVPAYNIVRAQFHPKGRDNGYILTIAGKRIYFAADTEATPEMKALKNIDVAFLPINLPYTMTPADAAAAARVFKPKVLVPYHQGSSNPQEVADALKDTMIDVEVRKLP